MHEDMYTQLRMERLNAQRDEAVHARLARELSRNKEFFGRRWVGRLGSAMIATGSRLEKFEHSGRPAIVEM